MKRKYSALFLAAVICFTFLFGMAATALDLGDIDIPPETVGGVLEDVLKEDPGVVGDEIKDGIYEGRDLLQILIDAINNLKIIISNFMSTFFDKMGIGESNSILG